MAVTMMLGPPGSGKSYEATVFHVLPSLADGRLVITNLPLNVDEFAKLNDDFPNLIELRGPVPGNPRPFSKLDDYRSDWRHPETGVGPLFVIDECHFCLPRGGTALDVEEWYSMHRHEGVDLILMTQSYGKVSKAICDIVQTAIVLRKNSNLGSRSSYRRETRDGLTRANKLGVEVRRYKKQYFPLYQSYTKGGKAEGATADIKPLWRNWRFYGLALVVLYLAYQALFGNGFNVFGSTDKGAKAATGGTVKAGAIAGNPGGGPSSAGGPVKGGGAIGGYQQMVAVGTLEIGPEQVPVFRALKGASKVTLTGNVLLRQGYQIAAIGPCLYRLSWRDQRAEVGCE